MLYSRSFVQFCVQNPPNFTFSFIELLYPCWQARHWVQQGTTLWDCCSLKIESNYPSTGLIFVSVTNPGQPQVWLTSFRCILAVGCLREASVGVWFSQNPEQIAVVGVSWHRDLLACLYAGGFSLTHEHLSPGPKSGSAIWAGGLHGAGLLPAGPFKDWALLGEGWAEGLSTFWVNLPMSVSITATSTPHG